MGKENIYGTGISWNRIKQEEVKSALFSSFCVPHLEDWSLTCPYNLIILYEIGLFYSSVYTQYWYNDLSQPQTYASWVS